MVGGCAEWMMPEPTASATAATMMTMSVAGSGVPSATPVLPIPLMRCHRELRNHTRRLSFRAVRAFLQTAGCVRSPHQLLLDDGCQLLLVQLTHPAPREASSPVYHQRDGNARDTIVGGDPGGVVWPIRVGDTEFLDKRLGRRVRVLDV